MQKDSLLKKVLMINKCIFMNHFAECANAHPRFDSRCTGGAPGRRYSWVFFALKERN